MADKAVWVSRGGAPLAPSVKRIDPIGWLKTSAVVGAIAGGAALALVWRPLPGFAMPPGSLAEHAGYWAGAALHAISPPLFATRTAAYANFFLALPDAERAGIIWRCAFGLWAAAMPFAALAGSFLTPRDRLIELRGSRRHSGAEAIERLNAFLRASVRAGPDHEIAPSVAYPADRWTRGTLIVGGVGAGKSTVLRPLIDKVVRAKEQVLLFDAKGEFTAGWRELAIIAPWDERSLAWDIAKDARNVLEMERFAAAMIRESQDPMWSSAARQILVGVMLCLRGTRGEDWGWAELREMLLLPQPALLGIMEEWHPVAARSVAKSSLTTSGILINLGSFCAPIFHLAAAWGAHSPERRVSMVEWVHGRSKHRQLLLQGREGSPLAQACSEGITGVFSSLVASSEMTDSAKRKLWFIADEFARLGKVPMELFSVGRSRGVRCVVAVQDFAQLEEIYGAPGVKALVSLVGTVIVGQTMQGESSEILCKAFGSREVERENISSQQGGPNGAQATISFSRESVPLYMPSELSTRLGKMEGGSMTLILFTGGAAYELAWPQFEMKERRRGSVPARWTLATPRRASANPKANPADEPSGSVKPGEPSGAAGASAGDDTDAMPAGDASESDDLGAGHAEGQGEGPGDTDDSAQRPPGWPFTDAQSK